MRQEQEITMLCVLYYPVALAVVSRGLPWQDGGLLSFEVVCVGVVMSIAFFLLFFVPCPRLSVVWCVWPVSFSVLACAGRLRAAYLSRVEAAVFRRPCSATGVRFVFCIFFVAPPAEART